ncbi:MAG TPA: hypothetical protein PKB02_04300 [Anaerohalosphaeraceae bacterium]|nr:hypothetical protein [Anaerohalosphaeraceae bacterium]
MDKNNRISLDYLLNEIKEAFKDVPCPKDEDILLAGMAEAEYFGNLTAGLRGVKWIDLAAHCYSSETDFYSWPWLSDLTSVAYRYYLPGYMMIAIRYYDKCAVEDLVESLILKGDFLIPEFSDELRNELAGRRREKYDLFSLPQKHVIRLFLGYLDVTHLEDIQYWKPELTPQAALKQYWEEF